MLAAAKVNPNRVARPRAADIDRYVGFRLRERRVQLGITQQQMAELIGVTYQQAHKYEKGMNRLASARLYAVARALGVEVTYFFEGLNAEGAAFRPTPGQRLLLDLSRNFVSITDRRQQEALCSLARVLSSASSEPELVVTKGDGH
jgi:transcriptional regulator with XRE-family HTH domain